MLWLFAHRCPLCERRSVELICKLCEAELNRLHSGEMLGSPDLPVFAWGVYCKKLKRTLELLKYDNRPELGDWLGERLGRWWLLQRPYQLLQVMAVPLHRTRQRERGYNQAERIARAFCRRTGLPYQSSLIRTEVTPALHSLGASERRQVLQDAFAVSVRPTGQAILLVDDILTTGSTLRQCASVLKKAGSGPVTAIVVAHPAFRRLKPDA